MARDEGSLFQALLRHFRTRRGLSQLDLALAANISARHVSFLETGRARPSREMVLRLGATLDIPMREQNTMLVAAGFSEEFADRPMDAALPPSIARALDRMLAQQEPYPLTVLNRRYDLVRANDGAQRLIARFCADPAALGSPPNIFHILFDPRLARRFVVDWERVAHSLVSRLHREALSRGGDEALVSLVRALMEYPDVPESFRHPDFSHASDPTLAVRLRRDELELGFLTTMTVFSAPQDVTLEELRIESYFPIDDATAEACRTLAEGG